MRGDRGSEDDIGVGRMRIGFDLLWVRVGVCGGTESFVRNLLDGFQQYDTVNKYVLFVSRDNAESFQAYEEKKGGGMELCVCPVNSGSQPRRILWENLYLDRLALRQRIDIMFIPVYSMPWTWGSRIPYVCVIHDLQAMHYPRYFSLPRRMFLRYEWGHACRKARRILTDSEYCRKDLEQHYPGAKDRLQVMYVPIPEGRESLDVAHTYTDWHNISGEANDMQAEDGLNVTHSNTDRCNMAGRPAICEKEESAGLRPQILTLAEQEYDYCVSSLLPHKNLVTLLQAVQRMCQQGIWGERRLVISGVGGNVRQLEEKLEQYGIARQVVLTGFVSDRERDYLYDHCRLFLFPSIFEGFGMPPIEAMRRGKRVVMTRCSCLEEITRGRAVYVDEPYDSSRWQEQIQAAANMPEQRETFPEYEPENIVRQYQQLWQKLL